MITSRDAHIPEDEEDVSIEIKQPTQKGVLQTLRSFMNLNTEIEEKHLANFISLSGDIEMKMIKRYKKQSRID